jgi:ATP-dependent DNA helicase RecG
MALNLFLTETQFRQLLFSDKESEHLEFKEAKENFNFENGKDSLLGYCIALANEGGGKFVLGVTDKFPRRIVGTHAFKNVDKLENDLYNKLRRRIEIQELFLEEGRVLILYIPSRPIGYPIDLNGQFLMRQNDSIVPMKNEILKKIYDEQVNDYTEKINTEFTFDDIDPLAISNLRISESGRTEINISRLDDIQLLKDLRLLTKDGYTLATLILLGKESSIDKYLPYSEIRYAYKLDDSEESIQDQVIFRKAYLRYYDEIWLKIDTRNLNLQIQVGMKLIQRKAFDEKTIREAVNNAIIHRDYSEKQSIIILHTNDYIYVTSPGGLLEGVTIDNILNASKPRNKLLADVLYKCGFVESLGSGVNTMYRRQLSLGKEPPDYSESDNYNVRLRLSARIDDLEFAKYVFRVANKLGKDLSDSELLILKRLKNYPASERTREISHLKSLGLVEMNYKGDYILSKDYYVQSESRTDYIKQKGISKIRAKESIREYLKQYKKGYMKDFVKLSDVTRKTIQSYLMELKNDGIIRLVGNPHITNGKNRSYWELTSPEVVD